MPGTLPRGKQQKSRQIVSGFGNTKKGLASTKPVSATGYEVGLCLGVRF